MPPFPFEMLAYQGVYLSKENDVRLIKIFKHFHNNFFTVICIHMYRLRPFGKHLFF